MFFILLHKITERQTVKVVPPLRTLQRIIWHPLNNYSDHLTLFLKLNFFFLPNNVYQIYMKWEYIRNILSWMEECNESFQFYHIRFREIWVTKEIPLWRIFEILFWESSSNNINSLKSVLHLWLCLLAQY